MYAHRLSYILHVGIPAKGLVILHSCDNPRCVNPAHLSAGTSRENALDKARKGRGLLGRHKQTISAEKKEQIRQMRRAGFNRTQVAEKFGIAIRTVGRICENKTSQTVSKE